MSPRLRGVLAALSGLAGGAWFAHALPGTAKAAAMIPPVALVVAAVVAQVPRLGAQLLARGLWWSNLVLGVLLTIFGGGSESRMGPALTAFCGAALIVADRRTLSSAADAAGFRPAAYGGTLQLLLVLALADAQTLVLFAAIEADQHRQAAVVYGLVALGLLAGFVGLLRLALWGVGLTMASAAVLAATMLSSVIYTDRDLKIPLVSIATLQIIAPLPMLASMALRRRMPELPRHLRDRVTTGVIALIIAAMALASAMHWRIR